MKSSFFKLFFSFLLLVMAAVSCSSPKALEYKDISNVRVQNLSISNLKLGLDVALFNPNNYGLDVKSGQLQIYIADQYIGTASFNQLVTIPATKDFLLPMNVETNLMTVASKMLSALGTNEINFRADGYILAGKGVFIKVPIKYNGKKKVVMFN